MKCIDSLVKAPPHPEHAEDAEEEPPVEPDLMRAANQLGYEKSGHRHQQKET